MSQDCLHMTALEVTHSKTPSEIENLVKILEPSVQSIADYTYQHRARLIRPMLSYDSAAIALSFEPAAGQESKETNSEAFTYHHLRRDLYNLCQDAGLEVASRYVVPSAHLTIARFVTQKIYEQRKVVQLVEELERINRGLRADLWPKEDVDSISPMGEWTVGEGKGLECRKGTLWYGGGETVALGRGFSSCD